MKIKTSELTGPALDWAVDRAEGKPLLKSLRLAIDKDGRLPYDFDLLHDLKTWEDVMSVMNCESSHSWVGPSELMTDARDLGYFILTPISKPYSTDWAQAGPIIERHIFELLDNSDDALPDRWKAVGVDGITQFGPTPLIAAMRAYVASTLGAAIDTPDELVQS